MVLTGLRIKSDQSRFGQWFLSINYSEPITSYIHAFVIGFTGKKNVIDGTWGLVDRGMSFMGLASYQKV